MMNFSINGYRNKIVSKSGVLNKYSSIIKGHDSRLWDCVRAMYLHQFVLIGQNELRPQIISSVKLVSKITVQCIKGQPKFCVSMMLNFSYLL